jgi:hypothetical protein
MQKILPTLLFTLLFQLAVGQNLTLDWAGQLNGRADQTFLEKDETGNIFLAGSFLGSIDVDLGPSSLVFLGATKIPFAQGYDIFLSKYTPTGQLIWGKHFNTGSDHAGVFDFKVSASKNIYLTGDFRGTVDFDPGPANHFITSSDTVNNEDIFVTKLDSLGNHLWTITIPASKPFLSLTKNSIVIDSADNVYLAGDFRDTVDFDPSSSTYNLFGNFDQGGNITNTPYMAKYDSSGSLVWAQSLYSNGPGGMGNLKLSSTGDLFLMGFFFDTIDFDPGPGTNIHTGPNSTFFCRYTDNGSLVWAKSIPTGQFADGKAGLALDSADNLYATGSFRFSADFNPNPGTDVHAPIGGYDAYILKLGSGGGFKWARTFGGGQTDQGVDIALDDSANVYVIGDFRLTVDFDPGPNTVNFSSQQFFDIFMVKYDTQGSFRRVNVFGGPQRQLANSLLPTNKGFIATGTFGGNVDLDPSSKVFNLTATTSTSLDLFLLSLNECAHSSRLITTKVCRSYTSPSGLVWDSTGIYRDTIPNASGCDSVVTVNLTVNNPSTTIQYSKGVLSSAVSGATYQWIDCSNSNAAVQGETGQSFFPFKNSSYALVITQNGCTDTSVCFTVSDVGITENDFGDAFAVSPNPTGGDFEVALGHIYHNITLSIYNTSGQLVLQKEYDAKQNLQLNLQAPKGLYLLQIQTQEGKQARFTLVRE